jgi:hypothetical protein
VDGNGGVFNTLMKAGVAELEKTSVARQWLGKHVCLATMDELLEAVFDEMIGRKPPVVK